MGESSRNALSPQELLELLRSSEHSRVVDTHSSALSAEQLDALLDRSRTPGDLSSHRDLFKVGHFPFPYPAVLFIFPSLSLGAVLRRFSVGARSASSKLWHNCTLRRSNPWRLLVCASRRPPCRYRSAAAVWVHVAPSGRRRSALEPRQLGGLIPVMPNCRHDVLRGLTSCTRLAPLRWLCTTELACLDKNLRE